MFKSVFAPSGARVKPANSVRNRVGLVCSLVVLSLFPACLFKKDKAELKPATIRILGRVFVGGPVSGATVNIHPFRSETVLAEATTDQNGHFMLSYNPQATGAVRFSAFGGTFKDLDGNSQPLDSRIYTARSEVFDQVKVSINFFSHISYLLSAKDSGDDQKSSIDRSNAKISKLILDRGAVDSAFPAMIDAPFEKLLIADYASKDLTIKALGIWGLYKKYTPKSIEEFLQAVATDLLDGVLNGQKADGSSIMYSNSNGFSAAFPDTVKEDFMTSIAALKEKLPKAYFAPPLAFAISAPEKIAALKQEIFVPLSKINPKDLRGYLIQCIPPDKVAALKDDLELVDLDLAQTGIKFYIYGVGDPKRNEKLVPLQREASLGDLVQAEANYAGVCPPEPERPACSGADCTDRKIASLDFDRAPSTCECKSPKCVPARTEANPNKCVCAKEGPSTCPLDKPTYELIDCGTNDFSNATTVCSQ